MDDKGLDVGVVAYSFPPHYRSLGESIPSPLVLSFPNGHCSVLIMQTAVPQWLSFIQHHQNAPATHFPPSIRNLIH